MSGIIDCTKIIDLGNYNINTINEEKEIIFNANFGEQELNDESKDNVIIVENKKYVMELVDKIDTEFNKTKKNYLPNLIWALEKSGINDKENIRIILGLPIGIMGQKDVLIHDLTNKEITYTYYKGDKEITKTITIKEVNIVAEGMSAYFSLDADKRKEDLIILDLGGRTCNVIEYQNKKMVKMDTINMGTLDLLDNYKFKYNNDNGKNFELSEIIRLVNKEKIKVDKELSDKFIKDLIEKIQLKFKFDFKTIWCTGGGSIIMKDSIKDYNEDINFMENPLYSNLIGNKKIASAKGWI